MIRKLVLSVVLVMSLGLISNGYAAMLQVGHIPTDRTIYRLVEDDGVGYAAALDALLIMKQSGDGTFAIKHAIPMSAIDVRVSFPFAYVIGFSDFHIVDVRNGKVIYSNSEMLSGATAMALRYPIVYAASEIDGIFLIDVSRPRQPRVVTSFYVPGVRVNALAVRGNLLYVANSYVLDIMSMTGEILSSAPVGGWVTDVDLWSDYAYLINDDSETLVRLPVAYPRQVNGTKRKEVSLGEARHLCVSEAGVVYVHNKDKVRAYDARTLRLIDEACLQNVGVGGYVSIAGERFIWANDAKGIAIFNPSR